MFFKHDDSAEESAHPVISHLIEAFKIGIKERSARLLLRALNIPFMCRHKTFFLLTI